MILKATGKHKLSSKLWTVFRFIILLGLAYILLYPLIYMMSMAFRPLDQVNDPSVVWIPRSLTIENVISTFNSMKYLTALFNTLLLCVVSSLISVIICSLVGYGFARFNFPLKSVWFFGVILTILVPVQTILIPMTTIMRYFDFMFFGQIGKIFSENAWTVNLLNTPMALYVPALFASGIRSGLFIFIYRQFFLGLPKELEDAAYIDGCGPLKTFTKVMLPMASGAILIVLLFSVVAYWNDNFYTTFFYDNLLTLRSSLANLTDELQDTLSISSSSNIIIAYKQAGAMLYIAPPLIFFVVFQKYFTESIERTGIVG